MDMTSFWTELDARIARYDLLTHAFYQAWSMGELTRDDLKMYATEYYAHVAAFPNYLQSLEERLPEGKTKLAIAANRQDELGMTARDKREHSDLWLDFAKGMGAEIESVKAHSPMPSMQELIEKFSNLASKATIIEALTAFYTYESQVPRIASEKALGLKKCYGADAATYKYFSVHATADIEHAQVWRDLISTEIAADPGQAQLAFDTVDNTAQALWSVLDGIEAKRKDMTLSCPSSVPMSCPSAVPQ